jgi:hypothetical protein
VSETEVAFVTVKFVAEDVAIVAPVKLAADVERPVIVTRSPGIKEFADVYVMVVPLPDAAVTTAVLYEITLEPVPPPIFDAAVSVRTSFGCSGKLPHTKSTAGFPELSNVCALLLVAIVNLFSRVV